jgi:hypothetical protein
MSEFSESLHFRRTPSRPDHALEEALRASTLTGALLPGSANWQTFVPFESHAPGDNPDGNVGARLSLVVGTPVLEYHFAEDIYWAVLIWSEGELVSVYTCRFLSRSHRIDDSEHDPQWLDALLPEGTPTDALAPVLYPVRRKADAGREAGKRFAEVMQLGEVEWLGPFTIADRLHDLADHPGVLVLGSPPPARPFVRMPKPVSSRVPVELPGVALSAREALAVLEPTVREWAPDATLYVLTGGVLNFALDERPSTGLWIDTDGRTTPVGGWWFLFRSASRERWLNVSLHVESAQLIHVDDAYRSPTAVDAIADQWMDSDAVARIAEPKYLAWRTPDMPPPQDFVMTLVGTAQGPLWRVNYVGIQHGRIRRELQITLHAITGEVLATLSNDRELR